MQRYRAIVGAVAAGAVKRGDDAGQDGRPPFITISRQAGAGGNTLKEKLLERLSLIDKADPPWSGFDQELVDKVAKDHHLSTPLLDTLDEVHHSYVNELFQATLNLGRKPEPTEFTVYRRVAKTVRALANAGRVIIVGRGGVFITRDMPRGLHVYLVAPLESRIEQTQRARGLSRDAAAEWVQRVDENREAFYRRYWPKQALSPEAFNVTLNTAANADDDMVEALVPLIPGMKAMDERYRQRHAEHARR